MDTQTVEQLFVKALNNPAIAQQVYSNDTVDIAGVTVKCEDIASNDGSELIGRRLHAYPNDKFVSVSIYQPAKEIDISSAKNEPDVREWFEKAAQVAGEAEVSASCPECRFNRYEDKPVEWTVQLPDEVELIDLDDHITQSAATKIECGFSMLGNCVIHSNEWDDHDMGFIVDEIRDYAPAYVHVYFDSEENAQKFAKLTGGEMLT